MPASLRNSDRLRQLAVSGQFGDDIATQARGRSARADGGNGRARSDSPVGATNSSLPVLRPAQQAQEVSPF
eukprot:3202307-Pyramimonas_sp.AAC.1